MLRQHNNFVCAAGRCEDKAGAMAFHEYGRSNGHDSKPTMIDDERKQCSRV